MNTLDALNDIGNACPVDGIDSHANLPYIIPMDLLTLLTVTPIPSLRAPGRARALELRAVARSGPGPTAAACKAVASASGQVEPPAGLWDCSGSGADGAAAGGGGALPGREGSAESS